MSHTRLKATNNSKPNKTKSQRQYFIGQVVQYTYENSALKEPGVGLGKVNSYKYVFEGGDFTFFPLQMKIK